MRFTIATIVAFIGMSNALPAPQYGVDTSPPATGYGDDATSLPAVTSPCACAGDSTAIATGTVPLQGSQKIQPTAPAYGSGSSEPQVSDASTILVPTTGYSQPGGGETQVSGSFGPSASASPTSGEDSDYSSGGSANLGGGLDLGGLVGGLLGGGKLPGLDISAGGGLNLEGVVGSLTGLLNGGGHLDGSGHLDISGLLDGLKGSLGGIPGGVELGAFCDQLKGALDGSGNIDLSVLVPGLQALLSGSGKFDLGAALGVDVGGLIAGLKLLLEASISGSGGLDIGALLDQFEGFLAGSGHLDLGAGAGLELGGIIAQLKGLLSASGAVGLDISGVLGALNGFLSGSIDFNGLVAACGTLPGGQLLVSLCGQLTTILIELGIDLNAIAGQLVAVLGGILKGSLQLAGSLLVNGVLDLNNLLSAVGKVGGGLAADGGLSIGGGLKTVGSLVGASGSIGGSIAGKVGGLLGGLLGGKSQIGGGVKSGGW